MSVTQNSTNDNFLDNFDDSLDDDTFMFEGIDSVANVTMSSQGGNTDTSTEFEKQLKNMMDEDEKEEVEIEEEDEDLEVKVVPKGSTPKVANVVCSVNVQAEVPLRRLACKVKNTEYNPKRFAAATLRIRKPKATASIFSSGRVCITGCKDEKEARLTARKVVKILQRIGVKDAIFEEFRIHNVVAHCNVGFPVKLDAITTKYDSCCTYEPEIFPGVVWRMSRPKLCVLIYVSGELIFTGSKSRNDVYTAFEKLYPKLLQFIKRDYKDKTLKKIHQAQGKVAGGSADNAIAID